MKLVLAVASLFLMAFYNTLLSNMISIYGVTIDLAVVLVTIAAFYSGEAGATWFAILIAIVASSQRIELMPWEIGSLAAIAVIINIVSFRMNLDSLVSRMVLMGLALLIHGVMVITIISFDDFYFVLLRFVLPGVIYSLVLGWILIVTGKTFAGLGRVRM